MRRALVLAALAACGGGQREPTRPPPRERGSLDMIRAHADEACACQDAACAQAIDDEVKAGMRDLPELAHGEEHATSSTPEQREQIAQEVVRMYRCIGEKGGIAYSAGVVAKNKFRAAKDLVCSCQDAPCALRADAEYRRAIETHGHLPADPETLAEIEVIAQEWLACHTANLEVVSQQVLLDMKQLRDRGCACTDDECVAAIQADVGAFFEEHRDTKGTAEATAKMTDLAEELKACLEAATEANE